MKKAILYLVAVWMLASIPAVNLLARASHGDWYFREEWGGTQYSAYSLGNGKVHYKVYYVSGRKREAFESTLTGAMIDVILNGRCETVYTETGKIEYFYPC